MVEVARPLSLVVVLFAAAWLACKLKNVHDSTNLSWDTRLVGWALVSIVCEGGWMYSTLCAASPESHPYGVHGVAALCVATPSATQIPSMLPQCSLATTDIGSPGNISKNIIHPISLSTVVNSEGSTTFSEKFPTFWGSE